MRLETMNGDCENEDMMRLETMRARKGWDWGLRERGNDGIGDYGYPHELDHLCCELKVSF